MSTVRNNSNECCPLCNAPKEIFYQNIFLRCTECFGIFKARNFLPTPEEEKKRYEEHNNDVTDMRYRNFVYPITSAVQSNFSKKSLGLDFGAGTGPVISEVLRENGYKLNLFDPFFINDTKALQVKYDYIVCCEVIEHFHFPAGEFSLLKSLLKPNGHLYCMTNIYTSEINFDNWYYKNDETHVFFYQHKTLEKIKDLFKFSSLEVANNLITYKS